MPSHKKKKLPSSRADELYFWAWLCSIATLGTRILGLIRNSVYEMWCGGGLVVKVMAEKNVAK